MIEFIVPTKGNCDRGPGQETLSAFPPANLILLKTATPSGAYNNMKSGRFAVSTSGFESIDHTVQLTHEWINDLDQSLGWNSKPRAYRLLRGVLQALHDWLQVNDAAHFGAQLPTLLRGVYYEHWRPAATPVKQRDQASFLVRIDHVFETDPIDDTPGAVTTVFRLLSSKITPGEIDKVRHALPHDLRGLWPASS